MANLMYVEHNKIVKKIDDNADRVLAEVLIERRALKQNCLYFGLPIVVGLCVIFPAGAAFWIGMSLFLFLLAYGTGVTRVAMAQAGDPITRAGADGEMLVLDELKKLSGEYFVLNQIIVPDTRSTRGYKEIDYVVVGPNGVAVIEAKNLNGDLVGDENDFQWTINKVGRGGTPYSSVTRNPAKQIKVGVALLAAALRTNGTNVWLESIVALANNNNLRNITTRTVSVIQLSHLVNHIKNTQPRRPIDPAMVAAAIKDVSASTKAGFGR